MLLRVKHENVWWRSVLGWCCFDFSSSTKNWWWPWNRKKEVNIDENVIYFAIIGISTTAAGIVWFGRPIWPLFMHLFSIIMLGVIADAEETLINWWQRCMILLVESESRKGISTSLYATSLPDLGRFRRHSRQTLQQTKATCKKWWN